MKHCNVYYFFDKNDRSAVAEVAGMTITIEEALMFVLQRSIFALNVL